jgi:branched-chain amino acid transport system ATP-binding protein
MTILELKGITKKFGGLVAVEDLSLKVETGEIYGIIGPNGAGKTTLFNCITGVYTPEEGNIYFDGKEINHLKPFEIASMGIVRTFQTIRLFSEMSVAENIMSGRHSHSKQPWYNSIIPTSKQKKDELYNWNKVVEYMKIFGLNKYAATPAGSLPYGIQRKVEIARALATEPKLLILDEPAAGLNDKETLELVEIISSFKNMGITILLIEHDMDMVMSITERIAVLNFGKKIAEGTPEEIQNNPDVIEAYLGSDEDE